MVEKGFYDFLNWFDDRAWYPLGRSVQVETGRVIVRRNAVPVIGIFLLIRLFTNPNQNKSGGAIQFGKKTVLWIPICMDPRWFCSPGSEFVLGMRVRIQVQRY